jgi:tRNA-specific 2-thiouridylase
MNPKAKKPLVVVGMSGGVDSSLAAFLLNQQGYRVAGVSLKLFDYKDVGGKPGAERSCCSEESINVARQVCEDMGIPHHVVDMQEEFKKEVISNFVKEYLNGRTPNPCIICNTEIKWKSLWKKAESLGAKLVATGHYARVRYDQDKKRYQLLRGIDSTRDQSYALWGLSQRDLSHTIFPLGELTKKEVRILAKEHGLKVADREESQEICFVPDDDYARFIRGWSTKSNLKAEGIIKPGPILNMRGEKLGEHQGIPFYTIGQRRGLKIAVGKPLYVVRIDPEKNAIYVGEDQELFGSSFVVNKVNWIAFDALENQMDSHIQIRYKHVAQKGTICPLTNGEVMVKFDKSERAITPGQSAVFFSGEMVLGGGVIDRVVDG